jgi:MmyB-like transcription regulator ligand binding domain
VVVNRWWELVDANPGIELFTRYVNAELLEPPVNVLRLSLPPAGMAPRIANLPSGAPTCWPGCTARPKPPATSDWPALCRFGLAAGT